MDRISQRRGVSWRGKRELQAAPAKLIRPERKTPPRKLRDIAMQTVDYPALVASKRQQKCCLIICGPAHRTPSSHLVI